MSLPIIRLRAVDSNNATMTDDPISASCTLYTFLRSVPSWVECEMAMTDFKHAVQATRGHISLSKNNAMIVSRIYASVHERLSRQPRVLPDIARQTRTWRTVLCGAEEVRTTCSKTPPTRSQDLTYTTQEDGCSTPRPVDTLMSSSTACNIKSNGDAMMVVVKETVPTTGMRYENPYEQTYLPADWPLASGDVRTAATNTPPSANVEKKEAEEDGEEESNIKEAHGKYQPHPMLRKALERLRATISVEESDDDRREREFAIMMESKAAAIQTKLSSAFSVIPPQEKDCVLFLRQLATRLAVPKRLLEVQRYEQETIQITHCALKLEIATMQAILHNIVDVVAEVEERHEREGPHNPHYAEECHIMAIIQRALDEISS